jgi:hypothetical protein
MNFINAKFKSKCAETGAAIAKGKNCLYDRASKKVYADLQRNTWGNRRQMAPALL